VNIVSIISIIIAVSLFMYCSYKGYNIFFNVLVVTAILFIADGMNPFTGWSEVFLPAFGKQMMNYVLIYVLSAIFAGQMSASGAAKSLAVKFSRALTRSSSDPNKRRFFTVLSMPLTCAILTYGGVSSLMLTFIIVAIFREMFEEMDIPWEFYCFASIGTATFALGMLPGSPDMNNIIPTRILGTSPMALPGIGILGSIIYIVVSLIYLWRYVKKTIANNEGFYPTGHYGEQEAKAAAAKRAEKDTPEHNLLLCLIPSIVLLVVLNVLRLGIIPALVSANIIHAILFWKHTDFKDAIGGGVQRGVYTSAILCVTIALGSVVASVSGFQAIKDGLASLANTGLHPIWIVFLTTNVMALTTASGPSAISNTLNIFGEGFLAAGIRADVLHRVTSMTALGLNTCPNSAAMANSNAVTKLPIPIIWKHFKWTTVVFPLISALVATVLVSLGIIF
jgi:H+/gluconate symporter-like permease